MNWKLRDAIILITLPVVVVAFSVYEWGGVFGWAPWHSVSFYARYDAPWLDYTIAIAIPLAGLLGLVLWIRHMRARIPR
jgi:hypothetical protein